MLLQMFELPPLKKPSSPQLKYIYGPSPLQHLRLPILQHLQQIGLNAELISVSVHLSAK